MTDAYKSRIPVWSWRDAIRKSQMSTAAKCLCYSIANYLNDAGGYAYPSVENLMSDMNCSNTTVARCVKEAVDAGYLHVQRVRNDKGHVYGTHYHPRFPECAVLAEPDTQPKISKSSQDITLHAKSSSRRKTLHEESQRGDLAALDEDLAVLSEESSRHNSPNKDPNNKSPLSPPAGGGSEPIFLSHGKGEERRRRRTGRSANGRSRPAFVPDDEKLQEVVDRVRARKQQQEHRK